MTRENAEVHRRRVKAFLPRGGRVGILQVTDKQLGMMELFEGGIATSTKPPPQQLELF